MSNIIFYFQKKWEQIKLELNTNGVKKGVLKIMSVIIGKIYKQTNDILSKKELSKELYKYSGKKLNIISINQDNINLLIEFNDKFRSEISMHRNWPKYHLNNNYNGFMALLQNNVIGYLWWTDNKKKQHPEALRYDVNLKNDEVYMFDYFIASQYRGGGNAIEFMNKALIELIKLGYKRVFGLAGKKNLPALWTYKILGQEHIKEFITRRFFNIIIYVNKAIFIRNSWRHPNFPFDYRLLYSFRRINVLNK